MKKLTKKEIYGARGIEFDGTYINAPFFGKMRPLLKNGNSKVGKSVYTLSMLPSNRLFDLDIPAENIKIVIPGTCPCNCPGCYAQDGRYNADNVIASNARNTYLAYKHLDFLKRAIVAQIEADNIKLVRIHASGDFFSVEYINMWIDIVRTRTNTTFWTYTKNADAENAFDNYSNANIVKSIIPGYGLNYGQGFVMRTIPVTTVHWSYEGPDRHPVLRFVNELTGAEEIRECRTLRGAKCAETRFRRSVRLGDFSIWPRR